MSVVNGTVRCSTVCSSVRSVPGVTVIVVARASVVLPYSLTGMVVPSSLTCTALPPAGSSTSPLSETSLPGLR